MLDVVSKAVFIYHGLMDLQKFFNPASIAVVGVSREEEKVGHLVAKNLLNQGYKGKVFFVNPHGGEILGKNVFLSVDEITEPIDLAVLAIPSLPSLEVIETLGKKGVKNIILFAAGFKEAGKEGMKMEKLLDDKINQYGMTLLGPNCIGYMNLHQNINLTFLKESGGPGNIGFISQSGAIGSAFSDFFASHTNLGFSCFMSLGNKTSLDESHLLMYLADDPKTSVIGLYLENVKDGARFRTALERAVEKKPVVVLKGGVTSEGSKAALSHTGGLAGDDAVFSSFIRQSGAMRAESIEELLTSLKVYSFHKNPKGNSFLVVSNAGGAGVLLTDELVKNDLRLSHVPIDLLGDASAFKYEEAIKKEMKEKKFDAGIILLTPQANTQIAETAGVIAEAQKNLDLPLFPVFMGGKSVVNMGKYFEKHSLASFRFFDGLPTLFKKMIDAEKAKKNKGAGQSKGNWIEKKEMNDVIGLLRTYLPEEKTVFHNEKKIRMILEGYHKEPFLPLEESMRVITLGGIPVESLHYAKSLEEGEKVAERLGYPLVLKTTSVSISHKTESEGVRGDIKEIKEFKNTWEQIEKTSKDRKGVFIQKQISGVEILVGGKRDKDFGPVVAIGVGGIYTELFKDVVLFIHPFSFNEFTSEIEKIKLGKLLKGFRNMEAVDLEKLYQVASQVGLILDTFPQIESIDLNPVIGRGKEIKAVDARVILS